MREADVKRGLLKYLQDQRELENDAVSVEEICLGEGRTRADLVVVGERLLGFEIKSPKDNLARLPRQLEDYRTVFDEVTLVIGLKHLTGILNEVPSWCGVLLASRAGDVVTVEKFRPARVNLHRDRYALAQLLWRDEARAILKKYECGRGVLSKPRPQMWRRLADSLSTPQLAFELRLALKARGRTWRRDPRDG